MLRQAFILLVSCSLPLASFAKPEQEAFAAWEGFTTAGNEAMTAKNYDEAERLFILAFDEIKEFGLSPTMAGTYSNLGRAMKASGKLEKAEKFYTNAVGISQKTRGNFHRDTAMDLHNLAAVEFDLDKLDLAANHMSVALNIMTQIGLKDDPATAPMIEQWARILDKKGDQEGAKKLRSVLPKAKKENPSR